MQRYFLVLLTQPFVFAQKHRSLTDEQRIIHVLNRLGFGARPGDVERVKAMGIEKYIEQQLHPDQIADSAAETKLANCQSQHDHRGALRKISSTRPTAATASSARDGPEEMPADAAKNPLDNEKNRKIIEEYYRDNGLQRPQRIIAELQASRILRAVYSERQLQEVMVDFWTNHFNIFANKGADRWLLPA